MKTLPSSSLFRAYDLRGIVGETLHAADMLAVGHALASEVIDRTHRTQPTIVLARDGRLSSPALARAMRDGLMAAGAHVIDIGIGPSPYAYFAAKHVNADGCVMITGSHNPKNHNGMKAVIAGRSLYGDALAALRERLEKQCLHNGNGTSEPRDLHADYAATLLQELSGVTLGFPVVWDAGNGAAGDMVSRITAKIAAPQHALLFCDIDGNFPNHHPDPSDPKNLTDLRAQVLQHPGAIGLAFDGDGDRLGVMDERGRIVSPDHVLMLFARDVLAGTPHATIIADVKTSDRVFADIAAHGGNARMGKTGHALIKELMLETGAAFAGEASGHIFFADRYYGFDDGLYAAIRLLSLVARSGQTLSTLVDALPVIHASPEWRIPCSDDTKFAVVDAVAASLAARGENVNTLDGMRVSYAGGWWLLRASNTQGALVARAEGHDAPSLAQMTQHLAQALATHGLAVPNT